MSYSFLETFPRIVSGRDHLYQPFTQEEWNKCNFATSDELQWFRDARYGMFIHFGLSTFKKTELSWGVCHTRKAPDCGNGPFPDEEWQRWGDEFQFEKFDASHWVKIAKEAGFKYIVIVTKHHDGFHMWDTDESEFKVTNTPFGRDFVGEVADACHKQGMPIGFYYSQRDWYHPDYMPVDPEKIEPQTGNSWQLKTEFENPIGDSHWRYLEYQEKVIRELCTRYGKIDLFWWDAVWWGGMFDAEMWDAHRIDTMIRDLQPGIVINNRCCIPGDFDTPEKRLGNFQNWRHWESCICLTNTWSYSGTPAKSLDELVAMLTMTICGDGNLLVSWGPKWDGEFASTEVAALKAMGEWVKKNEDAIYSTRGGPWKPGPWGGSVYRGSTIYLHILSSSEKEIFLPELPNSKVLTASLHGSDDPVGYRLENNHLTIDLPPGCQGEPSTIIELTVDCPVETIAPLDSCDVSPFMDVYAYGYEYVGDVEVTSSSNIKEQPTLILDLPIETKLENDPWVVLDFLKVVSLTAIELHLGEESITQNIHLFTSPDGENWKDWGRVDTNNAQIEVTSYEAGAWVPGHAVRFIKLASDEPQPSQILLHKFSCFSRETSTAS